METVSLVAEESDLVRLVNELDDEMRHYKFMSLLLHAKSCFSANRIYPEFVRLQQLGRELYFISNVYSSSSKNIIPNHVSSILTSVSSQRLQQLVKFADTCLPALKSMLYEGTCVHDFVSEHTNVYRVRGSESMHNGTVFATDLKEGNVHVYEYDAAVTDGLWDGQSGVDIRCELIEIRGLRDTLNGSFDVFNPDETTGSVYYGYTDLRFPFEETVWPVMKKMIAADITSMDE